MYQKEGFHRNGSFLFVACVSVEILGRLTAGRCAHFTACCAALLAGVYPLSARQLGHQCRADALATRAGWARQLQAQQAQTQADMERLRLVALRLEHGAASQLDVLELERTVLADQQALTAAQWAYLQSQVTLYKVLGGGPEE